MIPSRRSFVRTLAATLLASTFSSRLEAIAQEIAAPSPVRTPKELFDYVTGEARRLNQNKAKEQNGKNAPYDKSPYKKLIDEVLWYYGVPTPISSEVIVNLTNFMIGLPGPLDNKIFIQFNGLLGPDGLLIKEIEIFEDRLEVKRWERKNGKYFLPIKPILYYPLKP